MINLIYTILPVVCLITGFYFGFKIGKTLELPSIPEKVKHPIKTIIEEKEETKKCTVRMKASQKETIKKLATKRNMSESALINEFIEKGMKEKDIIDYYRWGDLY